MIFASDVQKDDGTSACRHGMRRGIGYRQLSMMSKNNRYTTTPFRMETIQNDDFHAIAPVDNGGSTMIGDFLTLLLFQELKNRYLTISVLVEKEKSKVSCTFCKKSYLCIKRVVHQCN